MTVLMDDPTSYLKRDSDVVAIMLSGSVREAQHEARHYGVSIQVNMAGGMGIRVVTTLADAINAVATHPASTPWCVASYDGWEMAALAALTNYFGPAKTIDKALGVATEGIAWRPGRYPVYGM